MEYLLGGCTGLLKEVGTNNKTLLRLSQVDHQSLDKNVTCLCWSGGFGGYFEDELTVGYKDGTIRSYNYLTMKVNREYNLDSKCIYLTMLNYHFDLLSPEIYNRNTGSSLYPDTKKPNAYETNDRLLLAVSEGGYIYVFDWSVDKSEKVANVKYLYKIKDVKVQNKTNEVKHEKDDGNKHVENKNNKEQNKMSRDNKEKDENLDNKTKVEVEVYVGALLVYKYKAPLSDARVHSLMKNRLVIAGPNNPPVLFDLFSESILWTGKFPHETVLGLQSKLEISTLCFLEEIDDDTICVATDDSFVYVYDLKAQRDPVFEFNLCDYRSIGLSKRLLSLPHEDFNTRHRRLLSRAINEKYSQNNLKILKLTTRPSYKLYFPKLDKDYKNSNTTTDTNTPYDNKENVVNNKDLHKVNDSVYIKLYNSVKKDYCNLYICNNFGTIYNLQFLTGDRLLQWIYRKVQPLVDQKLSSQSDPGSEVTSDFRAKRALDHNRNVFKTNKEMNLEDIKNLSNKDKYKIVEHLIEARKRLCSSSNNDKKIHFRRNHYSQFVCRILCCYNFHNGSVVDLKCIGDYLISAGLDRFSNVINVKTNKLVFRHYCNQKQTCILVKNRYLFETFQDNLEFKLNEKETLEILENKSYKTKDVKVQNKTNEQYDSSVESPVSENDTSDVDKDLNEDLYDSDDYDNELDQLVSLDDDFDLDTDQEMGDVVDSDKDVEDKTSDFDRESDY